MGNQCAIPVFDGLFPDEHNEIVLDLLFDLNCWLAFAKMRIHTDSTLDDLDNITKELGISLRKFTRTTCAAWETFELPKEARARARQEHRQAQKTQASGSEQTNRSRAQHTTTTSSKMKAFNDTTYKLHRLPDYARTIRRIGTTDIFSAQRVSNGVILSSYFRLLTFPLIILVLFRSSKPSTNSPRTDIAAVARTTLCHSSLDVRHGRAFSGGCMVVLLPFIRV